MSLRVVVVEDETLTRIDLIEIYGIFMSKRTISGCNFLQISTASIPSVASPTTS